MRALHDEIAVQTTLLTSSPPRTHLDPLQGLRLVRVHRARARDVALEGRVLELKGQVAGDVAWGGARRQRGAYLEESLQRRDDRSCVSHFDEDLSSRTQCNPRAPPCFVLECLPRRFPETFSLPLGSMAASSPAPLAASRACLAPSGSSLGSPGLVAWSSGDAATFWDTSSDRLPRFFFRVSLRAFGKCG